MRTYFQLFFSLILPLSVLFILASIFYFNFQYDLTKSIRIGVLTGVLIAIPASLVLSMFLLIMRATTSSKQPVKKKKERKNEKEKKKVQPVIETVEQNTTETVAVKQMAKETQKENVPTQDTPDITKIIHQKIMLLMDQQLAFEVLLSAIHEKSIGLLTEDNTEKGALRIKTSNGIIEVAVSLLTRHTSQIIVTSPVESNEAKAILTYMKEKDYSFTQY